ncbi:MAG: ApaG domain [Akkermansia sp.]|nr:ApaG domain [Akkermansia sp.]
MNTNPRILPTLDCLDMGVTMSGISISRSPRPEYRLSFRLQMRNKSHHSIRLIGRKWVLRERGGKTRIIEAANVFNQQPVLTPEAVFCYGGSQCFSTPPTGVEISLFGSDSRNRPFITPPYSFPRGSFSLPW